MKKSSYLLPLFLFALILSGCGNKAEEMKSQPTEPEHALQEASEQPEPTKEKKISLDDVKKHDSKDDCWTAIDGKVYDISEYIALGVHKPIIVKACGVDASEMFNNQHGAEQKQVLENYYLGGLK